MSSLGGDAESRRLLKHVADAVFAGTEQRAAACAPRNLVLRWVLQRQGAPVLQAPLARNAGAGLMNNVV
jgi:hypothetical protein